MPLDAGKLLKKLHITGRSRANQTATPLHAQGIRNPLAHQNISNGLESGASLFASVKSYQISSEYQVERDDPFHQALFWKKFRQQLVDYHGKSGSQVPFEVWLKTLTVFEAEKMLRGFHGLTSDPRERRIMADSLVNGVKYMTPAERQNYMVTVQDRRLLTTQVRHHYNPTTQTMVKRPVWLDTAHMETYFSGVGWAIWVLSEDDVLYSASHRIGSLHHSSFLSGRAVRGAGEWTVSDGRPKFVTSKTGHYKCDIPAFQQALRIMADKGLDLTDVNAVVYNMDDTPMAINAQALTLERNAEFVYKNSSQTGQKFQPKREKKPQMSALGMHRPRPQAVESTLPPTANAFVFVGRQQVALPPSGDNQNVDYQCK